MKSKGDRNGGNSYKRCQYIHSHHSDSSKIFHIVPTFLEILFPCLLRVHSLAQFEILGILFKNFSREHFYFGKICILFFFPCYESDEKLVTFQITPLLCKCACCGNQDICWVGPKGFIWGWLEGRLLLLFLKPLRIVRKQAVAQRNT